MSWLSNIIRIWNRWPNLPNPPIFNPPTISGNSLFNEVNKFRANRGYPPFLEDTCLNNMASQHAARINSGQEKVHEGFSTRLSTCGKTQGGAENWAQATTSVNAVAMWANSSGHLANMLRPHKYFGGAIVKGNAVMIIGS